MATITDKTAMKALAAIEILMDQRNTSSLITYGDLAERIGHGSPRSLGNILDAVGAWCRSRDKLSLVLTVEGKSGKPEKGFFKFGTTHGNYQERRLQLFRDDSWRSVALPTLEQITEAYNNAFAQN